MLGRMQLYQGWRGWALAGGIVVLYVALAFAGHELGYFGVLSVWYPPAGLALAAGLMWGWRVWPLLAVGELVGGLVVFDIGSSFTWPEMIVNALGYTAIYVAAGLLLRRLRVGGHAVSLKEALQILVVGIGASFVAALFGVGMQHLAGLPDLGDYWRSVRVWWIGDAIGIATITPSLLLAALAFGATGRSFIPVSVRGIAIWKLVAALALPSVLAVGLFLVGADRPGVMSLVFVPVLFVALRFGLTGAALSTLLLAPVLTVLANETAETLDRADLQIYLFGVLVVALIVGAVVDERERISLRQRELGQIVEGTTDLVAIVDRTGHLRYLNAAGHQLLGVGMDEDLSQYSEEDFYLDALAAQEAVEAREVAKEHGSWSGDVQLRGTGGAQISGSKVVIAHATPDGSVLRTASVVRDMTDQRRLEAQLERQALEDPLTGLANRAIFLTQVDRALASSAGGVVLVVKIDRYAALRETIDSSSADAVLLEVAERLRRVCGDATVARVDAASFGVVPHYRISGPAATTLARRIVDAVGDRLEVGGRRVSVTVSVGLAELRGASSADEAARAATVAVNRAEAKGGGCVVFHVESMTEEAHLALALESELRDAIDQRTWSVVYQPIVEAHADVVVGVEALLRFPGHDTPAAHIALAEENGLIVPLGLEIFERACQDARAWSRTHPIDTVHVNVSARQLVEPDFVPSVQEVLAAHPDAAPVMTIEVTETVMSSEPERASRALAQLRELGATIALDDFGTGYSSLATLHTFPIDVVKLDRAFTLDVASSERMRSVVRTSIELAHALGMQVVAEGVSEAEQLEALRELGCDAVQGFLVARPLTFDALLAWLGARTATVPT